MSQNTSGSPPVVLWYGDDPVEFGAILASLQEAKIFTYDMAAHSHLITYQPGMRRPQYAIFVRADQADAARKVTIQLLNSSSSEEAGLEG